MKKAAELRDHMTKSVPELKKNPDRLHALIEKGAISSRLGQTASFQYSYELTFIITDYVSHADTLMIPLLVWIAANQPDLMQNPDKIPETIKFSAEMVDHEKTDIEIVVPITESVVVNLVDGKYIADHLSHPPMDDLIGPTGWSLVGISDPID